MTGVGISEDGLSPQLGLMVYDDSDGDGFRARVVSGDGRCSGVAQISTSEFRAIVGIIAAVMERSAIMDAAHAQAKRVAR